MDEIDYYLYWAKLYLRISEQLLEDAKLINDSVEGWYFTKEKPSEELERGKLWN